MKENELTLIEDGQEVKYRILFSIEDVKDKNYIVYTKDEENEDGEILTYAATYEKNEENGNIKLTSIKNDKEWKFIVEVLNSIQNGVKK
ncbi:MAG: DUF1292 domain-containing protein [Bacilli bacterium]|nr:DUF1292 domain-containing protein [Bacilli bacterium]